MPRDNNSVGRQQSKVLTLYNQHREERMKRINQFWLPRTILEETESSHYDDINKKTKLDRMTMFRWVRK